MGDDDEPLCPVNFHNRGINLYDVFDHSLIKCIWKDSRELSNGLKSDERRTNGMEIFCEQDSRERQTDED